MKKGNKKIKRLGFIGIPAFALILAFIVLYSGILSGGKFTTVLAKDLMKSIKEEKVDTVELKDEFIQSTADFSVDLFKNAYTKGENSLISPTSVYLALGMTANGAKGNTLKEFEELLGKKGLGIQDLNSYYYSLSQRLADVNSGKVGIANSIWYRDDDSLTVWYRDDDSLTVNKDFLQKNANYYKAAAYKSDFSSKETVTDINNWVKYNTEGLIDKIIDKIDEDSVMYLINAVCFEDKWEVLYKKEDIHQGDFRLEDGRSKKVEFMNSKENLYIKDDKAQGFIKPYKSGKYSFVAILPNEDVTVDSYIASLSGDRFMKLMEGKSNKSVNAALPKFEASYSIELKDSLKKLGLNDCFEADKADFSDMAKSDFGNIWVASTLHKTFISVDDTGTKAAAVTTVVMVDESALIDEIYIVLDRPFIYAIIDNETNLPLFIGTMMNPEV